MASIFQRGRMWWIVYYDGGQKISYSLKTTDKTVARFKKNEVENRLSMGDSPLPNKKIPLGEILAAYSEDSKHRKSPKTVRDDDKRLQAFFLSAGILHITQIKESLLAQYINGRLDKDEINLTTANHTIKTVKAFLNFAVKRGFIARNPLAGMKRYKTEKKQPRFLSKTEVEKVLNASRESELFPMIMVAIYTGMRFGELANLNWQDIDLGKNTITVKKSKAGRFRVLPIHKSLRPILTPGIFPLTKLANFDALRKLRRITGMDDLGWHTFRHTFASHLIMNGVDIVTVSKLLGHSRIDTTMIYSHLSDGHVQDSIGKLKI